MFESHLFVYLNESKTDKVVSFVFPWKLKSSLSFRASQRRAAERWRMEGRKKVMAEEHLCGIKGN